jgi:hypothetical protein
MTEPRPARKYTAADVPWRLRDQLQLRAVLTPLTGRYRGKGEIPDRALKIRSNWRRSLARLDAHGWDVLAGPKSRHRSARECPMAFLMVYGRPRPCHLRTACPFCWARQAAAWWDRIDAAFFRDAAGVDMIGRHGRAGRAIELDDAPARPSRKARARGYVLVARTRRYVVPPIRNGPDGAPVDQLREFYAARLRGGPILGVPCPWFARVPEVRAGMAAIARPGRRRGCFENITADLSPAKDAWTASIRQVWMVPAGKGLPVITPQEGSTYIERVVEDPWRTDVMRAVALACRYPKAMLLKFARGVPAYRLVTSRAGLRLAANYGDFRGSGGDP